MTGDSKGSYGVPHTQHTHRHRIQAVLLYRSRLRNFSLILIRDPVRRKDFHQRFGLSKSLVGARENGDHAGQASRRICTSARAKDDS